MTSDNAWYQIENVEEIDSPALVIYLERVKHNIRLAVTIFSACIGNNIVSGNSFSSTCSRA